MYLILLLLSIFIIGLNGQIFNTDSIPLTPGANIPTSETRWTTSSLQMKTGKTELVMTTSGLKLLYDGATVWAPPAFTSNLANPVLYFKPDGNLCTRESPTATVSIWCTNYYNLGAANLNILPDGSYGRKWAIIVQDANGQMLWGRFGPAISNRGILPLIPGNFIDAKNSANNKLSSTGRKCLNNGKDYLCVNGRSTDILSFYVPLTLSDFSQPQWMLPVKAQGNHEIIFGSDSNLCGLLNGYAYWCNGYTSLKQRYVVVPIASDYDNYMVHGAWVTLDDNMQITYGKVYNYDQGINKAQNQLTFPTSGFSNDYISMTFTNGVIKYFNKIENKDLKTVNPPTSSTTKEYSSGFFSAGFYFFKTPVFTSLSVCNFNNQECHMVIEMYEKSRLSGAWAKWDTKLNSKWFCLSRLLPEATALDEDGIIIASSKNFNKTHYQYI